MNTTRIAVHIGFSTSLSIAKHSLSNSRRQILVCDLLPPDIIHRAADCWFSTLRSRAQWAMRSFIHGISNGLNVLAIIHRRRYTTIDSRWGWQKRSRPLENTGCEFTNTAICGRLSLLFQAREEDTYCPGVMILKALLLGGRWRKHAMKCDKGPIQYCIYRIGKSSCRCLT